MPYRIIDLFCGAGGLTWGFTKMGKPFAPVWANDNNKSAVDTYNRNFGAHCVWGDLVDLLSNPETKVPIADVVVGGPPCQGFSLLNRNRDADPRRHLWQPFLEVVERSQASVFVMENVPQLLGSTEYQQIIKAAKKLGFECAADKLRAVDYGVPQMRRRAFIIGCRFADPDGFFPPLKTHFKLDGQTLQLPLSDGDLSHQDITSSRSRWRTVRDAISDLPKPVGTEVRDVPPPFDLHFGRTPSDISLRRYRTVPKEGNRFDLQREAPELTPPCWIKKTSGGTDLFGRLAWDKPACTIRTEFFKPEKGRYLHPTQHRPITHREAARLQGFADNFQFCGSKIEIAKQIGNAVPPPLASAVADCVHQLLALTEKSKEEPTANQREQEIKVGEDGCRTRSRLKIAAG